VCFENRRHKNVARLKLNIPPNFLPSKIFGLAMPLPESRDKRLHKQEYTAKEIKRNHTLSNQARNQGGEGGIRSCKIFHSPGEMYWN